MSWEFISEKRIKKTRKPHKCVCCGRLIPTGSVDINYFCGKCDGDFQSSYECNWCEDNREIFLYDNYYYDFWDCIQDHFYDLFTKYNECDCTEAHGLAGSIGSKLSGDYLVFYCENCGKVWHEEYIPICREPNGSKLPFLPF